MYELFDGVISIIGGIYCYLTAIGVVKLRKSDEEAVVWRGKYGTFLKIIAITLVIFGLYKLYQNYYPL